MTDTDLRVRTTFSVEDPATLQPLAEVADQDARDARRAVDLGEGLQRGGVLHGERGADPEVGVGHG